MKSLNIELFREQNLETLINLRRRQIEEEQEFCPLSDAEIEKQIFGWLQSGNQVLFLKWDADIVGFAIIDTSQSPYRLKSFFASRNFRRSGMKVLDFGKLVDLLETDSLEVKINARNNSGRLFWETFGFREQSINLRFSRAKLKAGAVPQD